jgi:hypothetical protein
LGSSDQASLLGNEHDISCPLPTTHYTFNSNTVVRTLCLQPPNGTLRIPAKRGVTLKGPWDEQSQLKPWTQTSQTPTCALKCAALLINHYTFWHNMTQRHASC